MQLSPILSRIKQYRLGKLIFLLVAALVLWIVLKGTTEAKSNATKLAHFKSIVAIANDTWSDDFGDTSGLSTLQNTQVSAGQLLLIDETLPGVATSHSIVPPLGVRTWGRLYFTATIPLSTNLVVDILDATGAPLMHNVPNGGSLAGIDPAVYPALKLQAALTSTVPGQTPTLDEWRITWTPDYPYQIYLPVSGKSFKTKPAPPPPLGAAVGFTGAHSEYRSGKTLYFPSLRKNDDDWNSSFAVQNITGFATTLTVEFFRENGAVAHSMNGIPLRPYGSYMAFADDLPLDNGSYAVRVTATEPLAGMASALHASGKMAMGYSGGSEGTQTILGPIVYKNYNGWTSRVCIHNTANSPADVIIQYFEVGSSTPVYNRMIVTPGNGSNCMNLAQESGLPSSWSGAIKITTDDADLVVTIDGVNSQSNLALGYLGFDSASASDTIYIPRFQQENNLHTNVLVCNSGLSATESITVTYHEFNGSSGMVQPIHSNPCLTYPPTPIGIPPFPANALGSMIISTDQSGLIALIYDRHSWSVQTDGFGYHGLPISATTAYVPNVGAGLEGWDSTLNIQNPNPVTNTITLTFYNQAGDIQLEWEGDLPPYGMGQYQVAALPGLPASFEGSTIISATNPVAVLASRQR